MLSIAALAADAATDATEAAKTGPLQDTSFWILIAFVIVIGIFLRAGLPKMIAGALDKRAQTITDEVNEARRLREEAQELLAQYQRRSREAEAEAQAIIDEARADAKRLAEETRAKIEEMTERRIKAVEDKIARAEAQALSEVRGQTVDLAVAAAQEIIRERMDSGAQTAFIDRAISDLRSKLN